jgi:K+-transporting ATPase ATPase B chain
VLSDWIRVRITAAAGSTFIDRMIALVEGAERQKTPNEIALNILLAGMTLIFVLATATIPSFAAYAGGSIPIIVLVALFVTLIPTTIGALLSAIGIAGMDRLVRFNVLAMSGRAVEAAGDVDTLLLDKTGTITLGNRQATEFRPVKASPSRIWPMPPSSPRSPTRRRKAAPSSCSPRRNTASAAATWQASRRPSCPSPPRPA